MEASLKKIRAEADASYKLVAQQLTSSGKQEPQKKGRR